MISIYNYEKSEKLKNRAIRTKNCMTTEGGVEAIVAELAKRQAAMGQSVTCYNRSEHHVNGAKFGVPKVKQWEGIRMKNLPTIQGKGLAAVLSSFFATIACASGNYDIVHIHAEDPTQAMGYNNCCLVSDIPECRNVINDEGIYFNKGDRESLTEKLKYILGNKYLVNSMAALAADYICKRYSWEKSVNEIQEVYRN